MFKLFFQKDSYLLCPVRLTEPSHGRGRERGWRKGDYFGREKEEGTGGGRAKASFLQPAHARPG